MMTFTEFNHKMKALQSALHYKLQDKDFESVDLMIRSKTYNELLSLQESNEEELEEILNMFLEGETTGRNSPESKSMKNFWSTYKDLDGYFKKILSNVSQANYDIYQEGTSKFYLIKDNEYQGYLEFEKNGITHSHSLIKGGFYNLMFMTLLANNIKTQIFSDTLLSEQAIDSWLKLALNNNLKVRIFTGQEYINDVTKANFLEHPKYRFSVELSKSMNEIQEIMNNKRNAHDYYVFSELFKV